MLCASCGNGGGTAVVVLKIRLMPLSPEGFLEVICGHETKVQKGVLLCFTVYDRCPWDFKRLGQSEAHLDSQACKRDMDIGYVFIEA